MDFVLFFCGCVLVSVEFLKLRGKCQPDKATIIMCKQNHVFHYDHLIFYMCILTALLGLINIFLSTDLFQGICIFATSGLHVLAAVINWIRWHKD